MVLFRDRDNIVCILELIVIVCFFCCCCGRFRECYLLLLFFVGIGSGIRSFSGLRNGFREVERLDLWKKIWGKVCYGLVGSG